MGALFCKSSEDLVLAALTRNSAEAAELTYRLYVKDALLKLAPTFLPNCIKGQRMFSHVILERTPLTEVLFMQILRNHIGVFDTILLSRIRTLLAAHELELSLSIDNKAFILHGTVLTKM